MNNLRHITTLSLLLVAIAAQAATFRVQAPTEVEAGKKFRVEYVLDGSEGSNPSIPQSIEGAQLLYGPSVSTSMSMSSINGRTTTNYSQVFTMLYQAVSPGRHTIPPASIYVDGKKLTTHAATIVIVPSGSKANTAPQQQPFQPMQPSQPSNTPDFSNPMKQTAGSNVDANDFFVKISLSKEVVYEQEAVVCLIKLYTRYNVSSFRCTKQPSFNGFLIEELPVDNMRQQNENINGKQYATAVLKKCILYPQESGKLTITSGNYDVQLVQYDVYSTPMGQISQPVPIDIKVKSNSASVNITPLPEPKPDNFGGAVGVFSVTSNIKPNSYKTYSPATYSIIVNGTGNLKYIQNPVVAMPKEFDTYDPQNKVNLSPDGNNMSGTVTFDYTFVPQFMGDFEIPDTYFVYFNTNTAQYDSIRVKGYKLKVEKGEGQPSEHYKLRNMDIKPINTGETTLSKKQTFLITEWGYWLAFSMALLTLIVTLIIYNRIEKTHANTSLMRKRRASKVAQMRLKKANEHMNSNDASGFYNETLTAMWGYLGDKLTIPVSELSKDNIAVEMEMFGFNDDHISRTLDVLEKCEFAQYAPALEEGNMSSIYDQCAGLIDDLEKVKRTKNTAQ